VEHNRSDLYGPSTTTILANKQDVRGAVDELDLVENLEVERVANAMRCPTRVETCSCMFSAEQSKHSTMGIINGYNWLLDTISKNFATIDHRIKDSQNGVTARVLRKPSSTSNTLSRSSIRSNPFKPIRELLAEQGCGAAGSSKENLLDNKKKRSSLKKFLASCKNKTAPLGLGERMSKSQHSLHHTDSDVLSNNAQESQVVTLVTLDPLNLVSAETNNHRPVPQMRRPFTAPPMSQRQNSLMVFNIPGQVPQR